jgi:hypothetical protein
MHPGDIRVVTAVKPSEDSPFYRHSNLVVLPLSGRQPLADKMGGGKFKSFRVTCCVLSLQILLIGDLDGDMYFFSWNDLIITPAGSRQSKESPQETHGPYEQSKALSSEARGKF